MKKEILLKEIKQVEEDIAEHYYLQRKLQGRYQSRMLAFHIIRIIFAGLTALGLVLILFFPLQWLIVLTILAAMVVLTMSIFDRNTVYKDMIFNIQYQLQNMWELEEETRHIAMSLTEIDEVDEAVMQQWAEITAKRNAIYRELLVVPIRLAKKKAYNGGTKQVMDRSLYSETKQETHSEKEAYTITDELSKE